MTQQIMAKFMVVNPTSTAVPLSGLTIRYFFLAEGTTSWTFTCDYAKVGSGNVMGTFAPWTGGGTGADHYLEVSFTSGAGSVAANGNSGEIQARFNSAQPSFATFTQTGDYSWNPADSSYAVWDQVTLYQNGTLIWGVEP